MLQVLKRTLVRAKVLINKVRENRSKNRIESLKAMKASRATLFHSLSLPFFFDILPFLLCLHPSSSLFSPLPLLSSPPPSLHFYLFSSLSLAPTLSSLPPPPCSLYLLHSLLPSTLPPSSFLCPPPSPLLLPLSKECYSIMHGSWGHSFELSIKAFFNRTHMS